MNERIKELAEQAGWDYSKIERRNQTENFDEQKFALLIVRECADIAKHHVMNISTYADADFVDEQIKDTFGIEL